MRLKVSRRNSHFVYGVIQSGLTCAVAAAVASYPFLAEGTFAVHWARSWTLSWAAMLPVVLLFAPVIRRLVDRVTTDEPRADGEASSALPTRDTRGSLRHHRRDGKEPS